MCGGVISELALIKLSGLLKLSGDYLTIIKNNPKKNLNKFLMPNQGQKSIFIELKNLSGFLDLFS